MTTLAKKHFDKFKKRNALKKLITEDCEMIVGSCVNYFSVKIAWKK
jgi:hypothetical protein